MAKEKKEKFIEGEVVDKKPMSGKGHQYVSEKAVILAVVVVVLVIGGYFAYGPVKDWIVVYGDEGEEQAQGQAPTKTNQAEEELVQLNDRVAALESQPVPNSSGDFEERLAAIETTLKTLSDRPPAEGQPAPPDPRIAVLEEEVASLKTELEKRSAQEGSTNATFAQAVAALSPPLYQSLPFEGELEQIRILALEMPTLHQAILSEPLSVLSEFSKTGIPSLASLETGFDKASIAVLKIEGLPEDAGWWDKTWARIRGLVVVRHTGGSGGSPLEETLAQASKDITAGNLGAAIDLVSALPPREGDVFSTWLGEAGKRQKALAAYSKIIELIPAATRKGGNS